MCMLPLSPYKHLYIVLFLLYLIYILFFTFNDKNLKIETKFFKVSFIYSTSIYKS